MPPGLTEAARVFVTNHTDQTVSDIDAANIKVIATIPLGGATRVGGVAVNPVSGLVYVTLQDEHAVAVIDGITNRFLWHIPVGRFPTGVGIEPELNRIYSDDECPHIACAHQSTCWY